MCIQLWWIMSRRKTTDSVIHQILITTPIIPDNPDRRRKYDSSIPGGTLPVKQLFNIPAESELSAGLCGRLYHNFIVLSLGHLQWNRTNSPIEGNYGNVHKPDTHTHTKKGSRNDMSAAAGGMKKSLSICYHLPRSGESGRHFRQCCL